MSSVLNPKNNDKDECGQDVVSFIFLMEGGDQLLFCQWKGKVTVLHELSS
jgi:hypothetical protein